MKKIFCALWVLCLSSLLMAQETQSYGLVMDWMDTRAPLFTSNGVDIRIVCGTHCSSKRAQEVKDFFVAEMLAQRISEEELLKEIDQIKEKSLQVFKERVPEKLFLISRSCYAQNFDLEVEVSFDPQKKSIFRITSTSLFYKNEYEVNFVAEGAISETLGSQSIYQIHADLCKAFQEEQKKGEVFEEFSALFSKRVFSNVKAIEKMQLKLIGNKSTSRDQEVSVVHLNYSKEPLRFS